MWGHFVLQQNVPDHAGGAGDLTTCEDVAAASRASDGYDLPLPLEDDPPCHAVDGCPAGGCSYVSIMIYGGPRGSPVSRAINFDVVPRVDPSRRVAVGDSVGPAAGPVAAVHSDAR